MTITRITDWKQEDLAAEVNHLMEVSSLVLPRVEDLPHLPNIDYHLSIEPFKGCVGGDHIAMVNFEEFKLEERIKIAEEKNQALANTLKKNRDRFGILIADVAGHMVSDHVTVNYLHAAFRTAINYELKLYGEVTRTMFEDLNVEFANHITPEYLKHLPFLTLLYGEIHNNGTFRYLSAGHPPPIIFSNEHNKVERLEPERTRASTPFGIVQSRFRNGQSDSYWVNEITLLGNNDIMLLYTDGLVERCEQGDVDHHLEHLLQEVKGESAENISKAIRQKLQTYCPPEDDVSLVVLKKRA